MSNRLTLISLSLILPLSGCAVAAVGAAGAGAVTATQEKTFGEAVDDAALSTEVKSNLMSTGGMGEVDVEVSGGLVLLSGRVNTPDKRLLAESLAWSAKRTKDVANEINIEEAGGFIANASDELISARVRARLVGSSSVRASNINVETYGGTVYLLGIARNEKELRQAAEEASKAGGVNQVVSYIRLRDDRGEVVPYQPAESGEPVYDELAGGPAG